MVLVSTCACGGMKLLVHDQAIGQVVECHCRKCQSFHATPSVHYICANSLRIVDEKNSPDNNSNHASLEDHVTSNCERLSVSLRRMFCRRCFSRLCSVTTRENATSTLKLLAAQSANESASTEGALFMVNVGPLVDKTIPRHLFSVLSQARYCKLDKELLPYWATADDEHDPTLLQSKIEPSSRNASLHRGGCYCGECRYEFHAAEATEILHCYCRLCRRHSGSLYLSWVPVQTLVQKFRWTMVQRSALALTRLTESSQRYFCNTCGTNLAILYDWEETEDEETSWIWITGGSLDPLNPGLVLERRAHIYCRYKPLWYDIPDDDLSQSSD